LELFLERGYDATTTAEIAARAGGLPAPSGRPEAESSARIVSEMYDLDQ
jgi:hypothetical protein